VIARGLRFVKQVGESMPRGRAIDNQHIDYLEKLVREGDFSRAELAVQMSREFKRRITAAQVGVMLQRMRTPSDPFFRKDLPYRRQGARYTGF
jgi:hypothetical protein